MKLSRIKVQFGANLDNKAKLATLYSKKGDLVITGSVDTDEGQYRITHRASGLVVARFPKLAPARACLKRLLSLTNWSQAREHLQYDMQLLQRVREAVDSSGQVTTR